MKKSGYLVVGVDAGGELDAKWHHELLQALQKYYELRNRIEIVEVTVYASRLGYTQAVAHWRA